MQTIAGLFEQLREKGVEFTLIGDQIKYRAPAGAMSAQEIASIRSRREEAVRLLKARKAAARPPLSPSPRMVAPSLGQLLWWRWVTEEPSPSPPLLISIVKEYERVDLDEVLAGLKGLVARHEALLSRFRPTDGEPVLELNDPDKFEIEVEEIRKEDGPDGVADKVNEFISCDVSVTDDWLTRVKVFTIGDKRTVVLSMNHLIFDGASYGILDSELDQIGKSDNALQNAKSSSATGYFNYVAWERDWFSRSGEDLVKYWYDWYQSVPALVNQHTGRKLVFEPGYRAPYSFTFPRHISRRLQDLSAELSTSRFLIYLAALSVAVARWSGQSHFGIRNVADGRDTPDLLPLVGYLTATDPIAIDLDLSKSFRENLKSIEREYHSSRQLRLPSMHAYPCYIIDPREYSHDSPSKLAVVMNYMPDRLPKSEAGEPEDFSGQWPPLLTRSESLYWTHPVAAIDLIVSEQASDNTVSGFFRLNGTTLSDAEHQDFMRIFFDVISEISQSR